LEFISSFETEWDRAAHLLQSSAAGSSNYRKTGKDLFTCQETKRDFLLEWFAESPDHVVENLSSNDHLTYDEAKERIVNFLSNHHSPSGAASKNSKPHHEAKDFSSSNGKTDKKKKTGSSSGSNWGVRSVTGIISTPQALRPVIYGYSVKSLKLREIEMVPKRQLPSRKSLIL
jgi:hypothetical protein